MVLFQSAGYNAETNMVWILTTYTENGLVIQLIQEIPLSVLLASVLNS